MYDYIIIGAGIVGTMIARELSRYEGKVLVLEKESDVANHQTIANSAIIHSGHDPKPGTLKAKLSVAGNQLYEKLEKELDLPILNTGAYVVAHDSREEKVLLELLSRARENGVSKAEIISGERARETEPNLHETITKVLSLPTTRVTYPWEVAFAAMENAIANGAEIRLNSEVTRITKNDRTYLVEVNHEKTCESRFVINAAGVFSDRIASLIDKRVPLQITPRKGEYIVLDRRVKGWINHVIYPVPTDKGKGVLVTPQIHGNILLGPTSVFVHDKENVKTTQEGIKTIKRDVHSLASNIPYDRTIRSFSGIRATSNYDDFYIKESAEHARFYHVAGIDSPGLTAAPAIATYLVERIQDAYPLKKKATFNPYRKKRLTYHKLDDKEKKALFEKDSRYGRLVCKCEKITEAEIVEAMKGPLGSDTIKGIKKRARAGSGLCQGGYCEHEVLKIIARETKKPKTKVDYYNKNTPVLLRETKVKS
jgi:glycerol-3-phosphate dehydrogenase